MLYVVQENVNKNDCMHLKCEVSLNTLHNMTCLCAIYLCSLIKVQLRKQWIEANLVCKICYNLLNRDITFPTHVDL